MTSKTFFRKLANSIGTLLFIFFLLVQADNALSKRLASQAVERDQSEQYTG